MVLLPVVNGKDDTESVARDVAAIREIAAGADRQPAGSYVTGQAGFDADRSAAVEGIDGTLLAITRRARARADAADLPLAADRRR